MSTQTYCCCKNRLSEIACCTRMATLCPSHNLECKSAGKSVHQGHVKSKTTSGIDMLDLGALDATTVVWPHNDNCPLLSTNAFRMVLVHGSWHVGLGSSSSTDLHLNLALSISLGSPGNNNSSVSGVALAHSMHSGVLLLLIEESTIL